MEPGILIFINHKHELRVKYFSLASNFKHGDYATWTVSPNKVKVQGTHAVS